MNAIAALNGTALHLRATFAQCLNVILVILGSALENRRSGNQHVGACRHGERRGFKRNAAIDGEIDVSFRGVDQLSDGRNFFQCAVQEHLAPKARVDAHDQHEINIVDNGSNSIRRRRGIERYPGLRITSLYQLNCSVQVRARLRVSGKNIGSRFGERLDIWINRRNHEVHIERQVAVFSYRSYNRRTDCDVGDEVSVHDVDMNEICACFGDCSNFFTQARKVAGEYRGCDAQVFLHV